MRNIFTIENASKDILDKILLIECPKFLFPFFTLDNRNLYERGWFPLPSMIAPLDFVGMYEKEKRSQPFNLIFLSRFLLFFPNLSYTSIISVVVNPSFQSFKNFLMLSFENLILVFSSDYVFQP